MKRLGLLCLLSLVGCGPASAYDQLTPVLVGSVQDCNIYQIDASTRLVICEKSNAAMVRQ